MKKVNIVSWDNGGGLGRDISIVANALSRLGYAIYFNGFKKSGHQSRIFRMGKYGSFSLQKKFIGFPFDVNIFLERVQSRCLNLATVNCLVPNPEWTHEETVLNLKAIDWILCKTKYTEEIYRHKGYKTKYIGFTSVDQYQDELKDEVDCIHIAGRNPFKGTKVLTDLWQNHPEWPNLVVIQSPKTYGDKAVAPIKASNIEHVLRYLSDDELRALQNRYRIHLCPTEAEGFGHSLVEAMSCKGLVVTTNAPPMNELVSDERGQLVQYNKSESKGMGMRYFVDPQSLEDVMQRIGNMSVQEKRRIGEKARAWYKLNDDTFSNRLEVAIKSCFEN